MGDGNSLQAAETQQTQLTSMGGGVVPSRRSYLLLMGACECAAGAERQQGPDLKLRTPLCSMILLERPGTAADELRVREGEELAHN